MYEITKTLGYFCILWLIKMLEQSYTEAFLLLLDKCGSAGTLVEGVESLSFRWYFTDMNVLS